MTSSPHPPHVGRSPVVGAGERRVADHRLAPFEQQPGAGEEYGVGALRPRRRVDAVGERGRCGHVRYRIGGELLTGRTGIRIDEEDYPRLAAVGRAVDWLSGVERTPS
jgi:hypothetical protein